MVDKLNPVSGRQPISARRVRQCAVAALVGVAAVGAVLVGARFGARFRRRLAPRRPLLLDLAMLFAGAVGTISLGRRWLSSPRSKRNDATLESEDARFSHPSLNVQRISFA